MAVYGPGYHPQIVYGPKRSSVSVTASRMTFSKKYFQYTTGFLVNKSEDTFDTTSPGKTTDGWFIDTLDNITLSCVSLLLLFPDIYLPFLYPRFSLVVF